MHFPPTSPLAWGVLRLAVETHGVRVVWISVSGWLDALLKVAAPYTEDSVLAVGKQAYQDG